MVTSLSIYCLNTIKLFHVLEMIKWFYLAHRWYPKKVLPSRVKVELGLMAMKGYSIDPNVPGLEPYHLMVKSYLGHSFFFAGGSSLTILSRCSQHIVHLQPTGPIVVSYTKLMDESDTEFTISIIHLLI